MLNEGIKKNYVKLRSEMLGEKGVALISSPSDDNKACLARVSAEDFLNNPKLQEEVFGPYSLIVVYNSAENLLDVVNALDGQLTASIMADEKELSAHKELLNEIRSKVGRIIINGAPTGVEVGYAMQHGGPFPAATDSRFYFGRYKRDQTLRSPRGLPVHAGCIIA